MCSGVLSAISDHNVGMVIKDMYACMYSCVYIVTVFDLEMYYHNFVSVLCTVL